MGPFVHKPSPVLAFLLLAAISPLWAAANPQSAASSAKAIAPVPGLDSILRGMEQAQQGSEESRPYTMVRDYRLYQGDPQGDPKKPSSEVRAQVNFLPPGEKKFNIVRSSGASRGPGVVQRILENEVQMAKKPGLSEVSRRNYAFSFQGERVLDGRRCYVLGLQPLRKETYLLKGTVWVDAQNYRILQIEGEPARSPSWWLKSMHVAMRYSELDGVWLPVSTDAVADVRLLGTHTMTSRAVAFAAGESVAMNTPSVAKSESAPRRMTGASVFSRSTQPATQRSRRRPTPSVVGVGILPE
jgi:hypothetical protein